jgi:serine/threonine protein kinase
VLRGTYVLGDVLGVGGMGVVYAAVQRHVERRVAIKLPRAELSEDPLVRRQFQMEAIAGERIKHRNVVNVLASGKQAGAPYHVMEPLAGQRLGKMIAAGSVTALPLAIGLCREILAGLAAAHSLGIVHGDVKSDNVIVGTLRDTTLIPRLIDFGLASFVDRPHPRAFGDGFVIGTPTYLAPELVEGGNASIASDVYAMGILCYELVTGGSPFAGGTSDQVMRRQLRDLAAPMSCRRPGVPPALDELVARALAKLPEDRFPDTGAMAAALDTITITPDELTVLDAPRDVRSTSSAATCPMSIVETGSRRRLAWGTRDATHLDQLRRAVVAAGDSADVDEQVVAYLELARALVDQRELSTAIGQLEAGAARLARSDGQIWRLQLTLAALYDGSGDRVRACATMREAFEQAGRIGSVIGQQRARALFVRLVRRGHPVPHAAW